MIDASRTVHFNRGQRLTPEQLNSMNDFSLARDSLLARAFLGTFGIIQGFQEECFVSVNAEGIVTVAPGMAVNRRGLMLHLEKIAVIDLRRIEVSGLYYLQLYSEEILEEPYEDLEFSEIKGFRYRRLTVNLQLSTELHPDAVEVARVAVSGGHSYRDASPDDAVDAGVGIVDTRHATKIQIYSRHLTTFADHAAMKASVALFRHVMSAIGALYPNAKHTRDVLERCVVLQAEIQEPILAVHKVRYLFLELRSSLLLSVEELRYLFGQSADAAAQHWADLLALVDRLDMQRLTEALETFRVLATIASVLKEHFLDVSATNEQRLLVLESIKSLHDIEFGHHSLHAFAGLIYEQKMSFDANQLISDAVVTSEFQTMMTFKSQLGSESPQNYKGLFTSKGRIEVALEGLQANLDTIIIWRLYKRRGTCRYHITLNGKEIFSDNSRSIEQKSCLVNLGTCVSGQMIASADNLLSIEIPQADMEFGIVGLWVYQLRGGGR